MSLNSRSWVGFRPFLVLVASTPAALERVTPSAAREATRLLTSSPR